MKRTYTIILAVVIIGIAIGSVYAVNRFLRGPQATASLTCSAGALPYSTGQNSLNQASTTQQPLQSPPSLPLQVVAGENFWGSLVFQLGGNRTSVTSIVTDPNADPHNYESNSANAVAIANANLV